MKKASGDVIILHMCTKNHDPVIYASWDMKCNRQFFVILGLWFFSPLILKFIIWKKCRKKPWRFYPFTHEGMADSFLSLWENFCHLALLTTRKIRILKKWKKKHHTHTHTWRYYHCVPQMTIIRCMVPEIWSANDRIFYHFGLFFVLLPP